jgi:TusA-related sulfurtransferase
MERLLVLRWRSDDQPRILDEAARGCRTVRPRRPTTPHLESPATLEPEMQVDKEIDTRGLNCPLPILKAKKALADLQTGQLLKVLATDPSSMRDFQAFSKQTGNELVEQQTLAGGEFIHVLRRR